jgi:hypothetical protein
MFEVIVKYDKIVENGLIKKVPELYVVDAVSFTEAEKRVTEEISVFSSGEFEVTNMKKVPVTELIESDDASADTWYRARVGFIIIDEKTEKEKRAYQYMLVQATSLEKAHETLTKFLKTGMSDWVVAGIVETKIMDVIRYKAPASTGGKKK